MAGGLREELGTATAILPEKSGHAPFLQHVVAYSDGSPAALGELDASEDWRSARFLAYRALDEGQNERVIRLLSEQPYWFFKDGLILALAHLRNNQFSEAGELFTRLLTGSWLQFDPSDLAFLSPLFAEMERQGATGSLDAQSVRDFFTREGHWPPASGVEDFRTSDLCYRNASAGPWP